MPLNQQDSRSIPRPAGTEGITITFSDGARPSTRPPQEGQEQLECAICFEAIEAGTDLPCECRVDYCLPCWDKALMASFASCGQGRCPTCRQPVQVDFEAETGRLVFTRTLRATSVGETDWIHQQARPAQIRILADYGAEHRLADPVASTWKWAKASMSSLFGGEGIPPPKCICRGSLIKLTGLDCYLRYCQRLQPDLSPDSREFERFAMRILHAAEESEARRITCDMCSGGIWPTEVQSAWWCENGNGTILHSRGYYICNYCFKTHTRGLDPNRRSHNIA